MGQINRVILQIWPVVLWIMAAFLLIPADIILIDNRFDAVSFDSLCSLN